MAQSRFGNNRPPPLPPHGIRATNFCHKLTPIKFVAFFILVYIRLVYTYFMRIAKVFKSGNSQAVRLPKEFQFDTTEVEIFRRGNEVILRKRPGNLVRAYELLAGLPDDFMEGGRSDSPPQRREDF
jgi:antitoxin VapB